MFIVGVLPTFALDVTIQWDANTEPDIAKYEIYRSQMGSGAGTAWQFAAEVNHPTTTYTDVGLADTSWMHQVFAVDNMGQRSELPSNPAYHIRKPGQVKGAR
jgi:hypothetical protein